MKLTLFFLFIFLVGFLVGTFSSEWNPLMIEQIKSIIVNSLLFLVGISVGSDLGILSQLKKMNWSTILSPILIGMGSILGSGLVAYLLPIVSFRDGLAVGAGFGYYSLSSIILTDLSGVQVGTIALLANLLRETSTILLAPFIVKWFGNMAIIASGAATSMDITLPVIQRFAGNQYSLIAIINGVVLTILVPIIVPFLAR